MIFDENETLISIATIDKVVTKHKEEYKNAYRKRKNQIDANICSLINKRQKIESTVDSSNFKFVSPNYLAKIELIDKKIKDTQYDMKLINHLKEAQTEFEYYLKKYNNRFSQNDEMVITTEYVGTPIEKLDSLIEKKSKIIDRLFECRTTRIKKIDCALANIQQFTTQITNDALQSDDDDEYEDTEDGANDNENDYVREQAYKLRECQICTDTKPEHMFLRSTDCSHSACELCIRTNRLKTRKCMICRTEQSNDYISIDISSTPYKFKILQIESLESETQELETLFIQEEIIQDD